MRLLSILAVGVAMLGAGAAFGDQPSGLDSLSSGEKEIQAKSAASQQALAVPADLQVAGAGEGLTCLDSGRYTAIIPTFDPMASGCNKDPLPDDASVKAAWDKVQAKLVEKGKLMMSSEGQLQKGLARGDTDYTTLDSKSHWGDLAYILLDEEKGEPVVRDMILSTYRAQKTSDKDGIYLSAARLDFQGDRDGRLVSVIEQDGIRFPTSPNMMWGQLWVRSDLNSTSQVYVIRWHQLLQAWAEAE